MLTNTARKLALHEKEDVGVQTDDIGDETCEVDQNSLKLLTSILSCINPLCDSEATEMQLKKMNPAKVTVVLDKIIDNLLSLYV